MKPLRDQLMRLWSEDVVFVFPSQIAAAFWRKEAIRSSHHDAIREDRLISWDVFKEQALGLRGERTPANKTTRAAFVESLLSENASQPFLGGFVSPAFSHSSLAFADQVGGLLPALPEFIRGAERSTSPSLRLHLADARKVENRYVEFLNGHGLFEPGWMEADLQLDSRRHILVLPELIEDEIAYRDSLGTIERISIPHESSGTLLQFADTRSELRWVLQDIGKQLDSGREPDSIVLTVAGLESLRGRIAHEAERYSVPLSFRSGVPLSDTPVGKFLSMFGSVVASGFGVDALKQLLLNRCVPWINYDANVEVVLQGVALGCLGGSSSPERRWQGLRGESAKKRYAAISRSVRGIVGATRFAQLRVALLAFLSRFVEGGSWADADRRVLQRCLNLIGELVSMEEDLGIVVNNPLSFWLDRLCEQLYVERHRSEGVPVFAYRVAAGTAPEHHYLVNASQRATAYQVSRFPFLSEHQRLEMGEQGAERDLSGVFLKAYAVSGSTVTFSVSQSTYDGPALPASYFVAAEAVFPIDHRAAPPASAVPVSADPYEAEQSFAASDSVYSLQVQGATEYAGAEGAAGPDYTDAAIVDPGVREMAMSRQRSEERPELIKLSAGDIDAFRACPFSFLLSRGLGLQESEFQIDPDSNRDIGTLYHRIFEAFFDDLGTSGSRFLAKHLTEYRDRLRTIGDREFSVGRGMPIDLVLAAYRERFDRVLSTVLDHDAQLIEGHQPVSVEGWQRLLLPDQGLLLVGRFDRITQAPDGTLTLVDYKKRALPNVRDINGGSSSSLGWDQLSPTERETQRRAITAIQLPFYVKLIEGAGERVSQAVYYSLESGEKRVVFSDEGDGSSAMNRDRLDEVVTMIDEITYTIRDRILAGDYRCPPSCEGCGFRSVCRTRYVVR